MEKNNSYYGFLNPLFIPLYKYNRYKYPYTNRRLTMNREDFNKLAVVTPEAITLGKKFVYIYDTWEVTKIVHYPKSETTCEAYVAFFKNPNGTFCANSYDEKLYMDNSIRIAKEKPIRTERWFNVYDDGVGGDYRSKELAEGCKRIGYGNAVKVIFEKGEDGKFFVVNE